jgi:hypothetical protein
LPQPDGICCVDIATRSGWAFARPGERAQHGYQRFGAVGAESGEVAHRFHLWLDGLVGELRPAYLCFESPYVPHALHTIRINSSVIGNQARQAPAFNVATIRRLFGLALIAEMVAHAHGVICREVSTQEVGKFFLGKAVKGRAEKKAQTIKMARLYGYYATEDEADALAALFYCEARLYPAVRRQVGPLFAKQA